MSAGDTSAQGTSPETPRPETPANLSGTPGPARRQAGISGGYALELYRSLFELMPGSVVLLDARGMLLDANPSFCQQIGYSREELLGLHVSRFSKDPPEAIERNIGRLLAGEVLQHSVTNVQKDGSLRHYELRETAITLPDGQRGILAISNDITDRLRADQEKLEIERQILHAEKLKSLGVMAGGIAHAFNNLLGTTLGNIDLARMDLPPQSPTQGYLEGATKATRRAADLTRQMLAFSGYGHFVLRELDLSGLVEGIRELLNVSISEKACFELRLAEDLPPIEADAAQVQQVVISLVTNASEAITEGSGFIAVITCRQTCDAAFLSEGRLQGQIAPGDYVALEVRDTGCGMDASTQEQLFEPFFTTKFVGRGLGMAAVLGIVRGHRGAIRVISRPGKGTTVTVLFPALAGAMPARPSVTAPKSQPAGDAIPALSGTVLLVEDEQPMRLMVERALRRTGLRVLSAGSGPEAVALVQQYTDKITFALLDLAMPNMDGLQTLAELRRIRPDLKAVLTSGFDLANVQQRFAQAGFVAVIQKPYQIESLLRLAQRICAGEL